MLGLVVGWMRGGSGMEEAVVGGWRSEEVQEEKVLEWVRSHYILLFRKVG